MRGCSQPEYRHPKKKRFNGVVWASNWSRSKWCSEYLRIKLAPHSTSKRKRCSIEIMKRYTDPRIQFLWILNTAAAPASQTFRVAFQVKNPFDGSDNQTFDRLFLVQNTPCVWSGTADTFFQSKLWAGRKISSHKKSLSSEIVHWQFHI